MSQREVLIVLAHALSCSMCRSRLLEKPTAVLRGRALTEAERECLSKLTDKDFVSAELLAGSTGTTSADLHAYTDHAVVRLRHF
ncbi:MAG TPA: hypothetical protein VGA61_07600 [Anaerolineae bacterium]